MYCQEQIKSESVHKRNVYRDVPIAYRIPAIILGNTRQDTKSMNTFPSIGTTHKFLFQLTMLTALSVMQIIRNSYIGYKDI